MKQSRAMSMLESILNIAIGFGIGLAAQVLFLPLLGVSISLAQNFQFALIMTVISIARSYVLRRLFEALHIRRPLTPFMQAAIAERFRQIDAEGWDAAHDDKYRRGVLAEHGAAYALHAGTESSTVPREWSWPVSWWKPAGFRRDMVRGVALMFAEGDRFDRERQLERRPVKPLSDCQRPEGGR